jgi:predicted DNA-binding transcriptional regulator AlpA
MTTQKHLLPSPISVAEKLRAGLSISIREWCLAEGVSRETYYQLSRRGETPKVYHVGNQVRIAADDYAEWQAGRIAAAAAERETIAA